MTPAPDNTLAGHTVPEHPKPFLAVPEAAVFLGISPRRLYAFIAEGLIPADVVLRRRPVPDPALSRAMLRYVIVTLNRQENLGIGRTLRVLGSLYDGGADMGYTPGRGGHAPGHLRDLFSACFDNPSGNWYDYLGTSDADDSFYHPPSSHWHTMPPAQRGRWLTGQLWNCTDTLPGDLRLAVEEVLGVDLKTCSYACAVRELAFTDDVVRALAAGG